MTLPDQRPRIPEWTLGERMAKARESAGYTQKQMGAFFGVKAETISTWETGTRQPKEFFDKLHRWAEICNVDYNWLVTGSGTILTKGDGKSYSEGLGIVDEVNQPFPNFEYPPARKTADLSLVS